MSSHKRTIDAHGVVHYAQPQTLNLWSPWCDGTRSMKTLAPKSTPVTCLQCLRERRFRGGPGGLLPYAGT